MNGWKNWATWNVALWLSNDEGLYRLMRRYRHKGYQALASNLNEMGITETPDGASYIDPELDIEALDAMLSDEGEP
jgi:hypothetical protein